jgi:hypothetical protein
MPSPPRTRGQTLSVQTDKKEASHVSARALLRSRSPRCRTHLQLLDRWAVLHRPGQEPLELVRGHRVPRLVQDSLRNTPPSVLAPQPKQTARCRITHLNARHVEPIVRSQSRKALANGVQLASFLTGRHRQARNLLALLVCKTQLRSQRQEQLRVVRRNCNQRLVLRIGAPDLSTSSRVSSISIFSPARRARQVRHTASVSRECWSRMRAINSILASLDMSAWRRCSPELYSASMQHKRVSPPEQLVTPPLTPRTQRSGKLLRIASAKLVGLEHVE